MKMIKRYAGILMMLIYWLALLRVKTMKIFMMI